MLKHTGRASEFSGIAATQQGALAVKCPACPHPEKNIPEGWNMLSPTSWQYTLYLAMDANFWLTLQQQGMKNDPELGPGWAYFVEGSCYKSIMDTFGDQEEVGIYSNFLVDEYMQLWALYSWSRKHPVCTQKYK